MGMQLDLVPKNTRVEANGEGQPFDISDSATRTFLCTLDIVEVIEQESLDVAIWGSADGTDWAKKPLLMLPQQFYRGETRMILDVSYKPEIRHLLARWVVNRWGRVAPTPLVVFGMVLEEVAALSASGRQPGMGVPAGC